MVHIIHEPKPLYCSQKWLEKHVSLAQPQLLTLCVKKNRQESIGLSRVKWKTSSTQSLERITAAKIRSDRIAVNIIAIGFFWNSLNWNTASYALAKAMQPVSWHRNSHLSEAVPQSALWARELGVTLHIHRTKPPKGAAHRQSVVSSH